MMFRTCAILTVAATLASFACQAGSWDLPPITGNAPNVWKDGRNWTWNEGNPMTDNGAKWGVYYQSSADSAMKPMVQGKAYNFHFVWRDEGDAFDPGTQYKELALTCGSLPSGNGSGPKSAVVFQPDKAGTFKVELEGSIYVQNPSAGNALFTLAIVDGSANTVKEIKAVALNKKGGHGDYPDSVTLNESVQLGAGQGIAAILQSVNPGPATSGKSSVSFKKFKISGE